MSDVMRMGFTNRDLRDTECVFRVHTIVMRTGAEMHVPWQFNPQILGYAWRGASWTRSQITLVLELEVLQGMRKTELV